MECKPTNNTLHWPYGQRFGTILADPPWQFQNRTGKIAPEHKRLNRYDTMTLHEICELPVREIAAEPSHLYLWVPNALLPQGLQVMEAWGFRYISNIVWEKVRKPVTSEQFRTLFEKSTLQDSDFNPTRFVPGTSGATQLYNTLLEDLELAGVN
jgi:hypothetical protein